MKKELWQEILLPSGNEDHVWELFHENSKVGAFGKTLSNDEVRGRMAEFHESLPYEGYPAIDLPPLAPLSLPLETALAARVSTRSFVPCLVSQEKVATLLHYSYGVTRDNKGTTMPRSFRVVPSGGALYPLEIYLHSAHIQDLAPGLYHYNPTKNNLRHLQGVDATNRIAEALVQPEIALGASLIFFITAVFERSIFKYGDRGYRFIFLEAGHVAQNLNLTGNALGLGSVNIGGFLDRRVDHLLGLDGITHSTIYLVAIGEKSN